MNAIGFIIWGILGLIMVAVEIYLLLWLIALVA